MKTLHVINLGKMGGVERLFLEYINGENAKDDLILCIGDHIGEEIFTQLKNKNISFANRIFSTSKIKYPSFIRKYVLKRKIERTNADLVIVWDLVLSLPGKPSKGKMVYYDHGCSWRYKKNSKTLQFFSMLDGCLAASVASKRVMQLRFNLPCNIEVIANRIVEPSNINRCPRKIGKQIKLGTASRLVGLKGISVSILMVKELINRKIDVMLFIAGKGPIQIELERLVDKLNLQDNIKFLGFQSELSDFFNNIDIYMSTPITEPFGLSCLEALYYGVPVIYPMIDGQPEVVKDHYCGIGIIPRISPREHYSDTNINIDFPHQVYDPINDCLKDPLILSPIECADAVEKIVDHDNYQLYRENAFSHAIENFEHSKFEKELNNLLKSILKKNP